MSSLPGDLDTLKVIIQSLLEQFAKGSKTSNGLHALLEATQSVHITILQPSFRQRSDAGRLLTDIREITKLAFANLQDLQFLIDPKRDRSRRSSPQSDADDTARNQAIFSNLSRHATQFQKIIDFAAGREDWSKLAPKPPRAPSASPHSANRLRPVDTSSSNVAISMPSSPYATTIEDVDDTDAEEGVPTNVEHVHYVHKDESPITPTTGSSSMSKAHRRVIPPQTPPQVVIRQATDPKQFSDSPPTHQKQSSISASPLRAAAGADDFSDSEDEHRSPPDPALRPSALPKLVTKQERPSKTISDLQDEINKLQSQIDKFKTGDSGSESGRPNSGGRDSVRPEVGKRRTSGKHHSVDLGRSGNTLDTPSDMRRPRASTGQSSERPKSFVEGSSYDPYGGMPPPPRPDKLKRTLSQKSARGPSRSPRATPYSAFERSEYSWDYPSQQVPQSAADVYGLDPRLSLPTVVERDTRTGRPLGRKNHRKSDAFEDPRDNFHDYFRDGDSGAADFPLFGPSSSGPSQGRQPRSRGNSRANDTSPNSKPYISPRQLHESIGLEPDVREISVSLEDVFFGTLKKYKIKRDKYNAHSGIITQEECILEVPISRGLKPKSKIKFEGEGHETPEGKRELHFQLTEKAHSTFTRVDYDLHCTIEITLAESLCGWERVITTIDEKEVRFSHPGPTPANWRDDRAGLGMCLFKNPDQRGDLIASVQVKNQAPLTEMQKKLIRQALGGERSPRSSGNFF